MTDSISPQEFDRMGVSGGTVKIEQTPSESDGQNGQVLTRRSRPAPFALAHPADPIWWLDRQLQRSDCRRLYASDIVAQGLQTSSTDARALMPPIKEIRAVLRTNPKEIPAGFSILLSSTSIFSFPAQTPWQPQNDHQILGSSPAHQTAQAVPDTEEFRRHPGIAHRAREDLAGAEGRDPHEDV
jgi:hypothetical protein